MIKILDLSYSENIEKKVKKTTIELVKPDLNLKSEDGWVGFNIRWSINDENMRATQGTLGYVFFPPKSEHKMHIHDYAEEFIIYLSGCRVRVMGNEEYKVGPRDVAFVPRVVPYGLKSADPHDPMTLWCFYAGVSNVSKTRYRLVVENKNGKGR